jgi:hypothetical protein
MSQKTYIELDENVVARVDAMKGHFGLKTKVRAISACINVVYSLLENTPDEYLDASCFSFFNKYGKEIKVIL